MAPAQPNHDPALAQPPPNPPQIPASQPQQSAAPAIPAPPDLPNVHLSGLDQNQIMSLLRHLPGVFGKVSLCPRLIPLFQLHATLWPIFSILHISMYCCCSAIASMH
ncbi:hypothetical protein P691DRAFT_809582 [Macrolepiota fuliginosa MF-IS2]|uniref:Uncharacterized protein n=1 Tax=Macrolepiota fuliginosa MF-IS2 TaxID=1400762 RepID=A0A9P5XKB2_9AGAR|nr:hypothetical protein P691DRAFT_809582 [Macrolepiota fuliginosa MF-IS2]